MGLLYATARLLLAARREGFAFDNIVTLGRQQVFVQPQQVRRLLEEFDEMPESLRAYQPKFGEFCEPFMSRLLGSQSIESIDFSNFEGATIEHDMNYPVDESMDQKFDAVIDGGTIEHIFNVPIVLQNCMRMTRVGGCVVISTNANNHCGHGFFQFSPELLFRVFQPAHGFQVCKMILVQHPYPGAELSTSQQFFEVVDPDEVKSRVGLVSRFPTQIMVLAKRISAVPIFAQMPLQSDYQQQWQTQQGDSDQPPPQGAPPIGAVARLRRLVGNAKRGLRRGSPVGLQRWMTGREQLREYSLKNRKFYRPWNP